MFYMTGYAWELFRVLLETDSRGGKMGGVLESDLPGLTDLRAPPPLRKLRGSRGRTANFFLRQTFLETISFFV